MTAAPPAVVTIPPGETVVYVAPPPRQFKPGVTVRDRGLVVTWRGMEEDNIIDFGHRCKYKGLVSMASARITIAAWHDDCGRSPRVELSAAGARRPVRVAVAQVWSEGPPVEPEPLVAPVLDPARLACTYDGQPIDVEFAPEAVTLAHRFLFGPVTP